MHPRHQPVVFTLPNHERGTELPREFGTQLLGHHPRDAVHIGKSYLSRRRKQTQLQQPQSLAMAICLALLVTLPRILSQVSMQEFACLPRAMGILLRDHEHSGLLRAQNIPSLKCRMDVVDGALYD